MSKHKSSLSKEEVLHIAKLANLFLSENEISKFQKWLSETLDYINILDQIDTKESSPTYQVTGLVNVFRKDEKKPSFTQDQALSNTKNSHDGYFKVKAIFEE